ncbi:MAG TPA: divalent-cation tolerance protein CutA [Longimicrobiales bacterium]|nr:divalent-cation tolerance protein CutA [Longimicrobiales bacterium]
MDVAACVVLVTAPSGAVAESIVTAVVEARLAACGNIVPGLVSIYRWEGALHKDAEVLILFKTTAGAVTALTERVVALHPYDVPEVLVLPVSAGSEPYLAWIRASVDG